MYKELIISALIVISIFVLDYITQKYTDDAINEAIQDLTTIKQALQEDNVNQEKVIKDAGENYDKWLNYHKTLAFYIEHNELEKVETNYVSGNSFIENAKYEDALSELEKTIFVLQHINDKYSMNLENIF
jgi:DNA repair ATPase RecN